MIFHHLGILVKQLLVNKKCFAVQVFVNINKYKQILLSV
jgi:hypothetical protein